ncbi:hypothetical protein [Jiella marina]|uniref:hypothetical protein n=1 Tax=Jiella sp. LLJ827 TaxID=2917712 RepID=UPI0021017DB3|nr:hypothetical protein [Jiella sp. LLJ827]MCQ0990630.1 hypothetical protein [Jiella sp. LLJ827]
MARRAFAVHRYLSHGVDLVGRDVAMVEHGRRGTVLRVETEEVDLSDLISPGCIIEMNTAIVRETTKVGPLYYELNDSDRVMLRCSDEDLQDAHRAYLDGLASMVMSEETPF